MSLGTFLFFITIFCVWLARLTYHATSQEEAVALVEKAKGEVHFSYEARDWPLPYQEFSSSNTFDPAREIPGPKRLQNAIGPDYFRSLVAVGLADRKAGSRELIDALTKLPDLRWLDLARNDITNDMIPKIASMNQLRVLVLDRNPKLNDEGLAKLTTLSNLEVLDLSLMRKITGSFLKDARRMKNLRELDVQDTGFQGDNLRFLAGHPSIRRLTLRKTTVEDDDLRHLATMPELRLLSIGYTPITVKGIASLVDIPLIHLYIEGETVADEWVPHLSRMKTLEFLAIWDTQIGDGAIQDLKKALPKCRIDDRR